MPLVAQVEGPSRYGSVDLRNGFHREQSHFEPQLHNGAYSEPPAAQMDGPAHTNNETRHEKDGFPQPRAKHPEMEQPEQHDDSGIGMELELPPYPWEAWRFLTLTSRLTWTDEILKALLS